MIYEFYWSWYEDYCPYLFEHKEAKSKDEFEADCKKALSECLEEYLAQEDSWAGMSDWIEYACKSLTKYGYKRIHPIDYGWFGGYIVKDDSTNKKMKAEFQKAYNLFVEHNKRLEEELYKDIKKTNA